MWTRRRIFLVPLANDEHGKGRIINGFISQARHDYYVSANKNPYTLTSHANDKIDAFIFPRSYYEVEKGEYNTVRDCLYDHDSFWERLDLIVLPNHTYDRDFDDNKQMVRCARDAGFDPICVPILFDAEYPSSVHEHLRLKWSERWTIFNADREHSTSMDQQLRSIGKDLWWRVSKEILGC